MRWLLHCPHKARRRICEWTSVFQVASEALFCWHSIAVCYMSNPPYKEVLVVHRTRICVRFSCVMFFFLLMYIHLFANGFRLMRYLSRDDMYAFWCSVWDVASVDEPLGARCSRSRRQVWLVWWRIAYRISVWWDLEHACIWRGHGAAAAAGRCFGMGWRSLDLAERDVTDAVVGGSWLSSNTVSFNSTNDVSAKK